MVRYQVGLEFSQVNVQSAIESQGGGDRGDNLADQSVQVGVGGAFNVQVASADVVDGFVVNHEGAVGMLKSGVGGQDGVVGFDYGGGDLWGGVNGEFQFGFLAVVNGQPFHQQGGETGAGATAEGVEDEETLQAGTLVGEFANTVQD